MPIYEYACPKCKHRFESLRPISRCEDTCECPKCNTSSKRAMSRFVNRSSMDLSSFAGQVPASGGSSCSGCSSGNCASCGG
jgi:putative FmdB family regulatory protein